MKRLAGILISICSLFSEVVSGKVVQTHCINDTVDVSFTQSHMDGDLRDARNESNRPELDALPEIQLAFSRPSYFLVCADNEYIHGIMVAIRMFPQEDYSFALSDPKLMEEIEQLGLYDDSTSSRAYQR